VLSPYAHGYGARPFGPAAPAPADSDLAVRGRWDNLMRVPRGSVVDLLAMDGVAYNGPITAVDGTSVRVTVNGVDEEIGRADVLRVDLVDLPGSEAGAVVKQAGLGAALGVGAAALIAGVIGGPAWPPPGALIRGGAAIGGVAGAEAALVGRRQRTIYLAEYQAQLPTRTWPAGHLRSAGPAAQPARRIPASDWPAIAGLPSGVDVRVVRTSGAPHRGVLMDVDDELLRLDIQGAELRIRRDSVVRVEVWF
jgi:hypothetical protein